MSRVDKLLEAAGSSAVKFREFIRVASKNPEIVVCIFEGDDEKYYSNRISSHLVDVEWVGINSGGKKVVLDLFNTIKNHPKYSESRALYFIDRDFETWLSSPDHHTVYVTPCYSIENFYISEQALKKILAAEFGVTEFNENRDGFSECIRIFRTLKGEFRDSTYAFNVWVMAHRIMERDGKAPKKLNVRNVKGDDLVEISLSGVNVQYNTSDPKSVFKDSLDLEFFDEALNEAKEFLNNAEWERWYRGKQVMDFLRAFLSCLKSDISSRSPSLFSKRSKVRLALSGEGVISELSQYADTPDCLIGFLKEYRSSLAA